jgi:uncharacterized short protein YbdD (DUF466 family)
MAANASAATSSSQAAKWKQRAGKFWKGLREWCGDSAYENYARCAKRQGVSPMLTPEEFYVDQLNHKYSRPNRCC